MAAGITSTIWTMRDLLAAEKLRAVQMRKRLNDRIKELCAKAVETPVSPELEEILQELQKALHEHSEQLRAIAGQYSEPSNRRTAEKD
jgi:hypothetical protein